MLKRLDILPKGECLCHGDFNPGNIILSSDGKLFVIDWAHAAMGNPIADAAKTYILFCLFDDFEAAQMYLSAFCEKNKASLQDVQEFIPIVAATCLVEANESEREFLISEFLK